MTSSIKRILWATDGSSESYIAEGYVSYLTRLWSAELIAITILEFPAGMDRNHPVNEIYLAHLLKDATRNLVDAKARLAEQGIAAETRIATGIPSEELLTAARTEQADLIVVGTRGKTGLAHVLLGSTAERVIRAGSCPVLAVRTNADRIAGKEAVFPRAMKVSRIFVPVDFSDCSLDAIEYAAIWARQTKGAITLFHVLEPVSYGLDFTLGQSAERQRTKEVMNRRLDHIAGALTRAGLTVDHRVYGGYPADSILEHVRASHADLIVMGTHGRRGLSHVLMGSVAEAVLRQAPCPVLTVRSPKFSPDHQRLVAADTSRSATG
jgi:nucleotide-binding universal stress UspA family protein